MPKTQTKSNCRADFATHLIMQSRREELASHVADRAGVPVAFADYGLRAVLTAIGPQLSPTGRELVADELPPTLAPALESTPIRALDPHDLLPGMRPGQAHALVASVCRVLADELSTDALAALRAALSPELARLLTPRH